MPSFCALPNCELKYSKSENVSFHKFPQSNLALRKKWIKFTKRENWTPSRWSALCSRHFKPEDFKSRKFATRMTLKTNVYPTIRSKNSKEVRTEPKNSFVSSKCKATVIDSECTNTVAESEPTNIVAISEPSHTVSASESTDTFSLSESINAVEASEPTNTVVASQSKNNVKTSESAKINTASDNKLINSIKLNTVEPSKPPEVKNNNIKIESVIPVSTYPYRSSFMTHDFESSGIFTTLHTCTPYSPNDDIFRTGTDLNIEHNSNSLTLNEINASSDISNTSNENVTTNESELAVDQLKTNATNKENRNCRLCSNGIDITDSSVSFSTDFEIFGTLQKCFPTLNIQQEDNYPKNICSFCLEKLDDFSDFIDCVIESQKRFDQRFQKLPVRNERMKIKQEPNLRIKQEASDTKENKIENHYAVDKQLKMKQQSDLTIFDDEIEQKSHFYDLPILEVKDMDIMEIISLDDAFIDIDEMTNDEDLLDSELLKITDSLKNIDNDKVQKDKIEIPINTNDLIKNDLSNKDSHEEILENEKDIFQKDLFNDTELDLQIMNTDFFKCSSDNNKLATNNNYEPDISKKESLQNFEFLSSNNIAMDIENSSNHNRTSQTKSRENDLLHEQYRVKLDLSDNKENLHKVGNKEEDVKHFNDKQNFCDPFRIANEHNYSKYYSEEANFNYKTEEPEYGPEDLDENLQEQENIFLEDIAELPSSSIKNDQNKSKVLIVENNTIPYTIGFNEHNLMFNTMENNSEVQASYINYPTSKPDMYPMNVTSDLNRTISSLNPMNSNSNNQPNLISSTDQNLCENFIKTTPTKNSKQRIVVLNESILKPSYDILKTNSDSNLLGQSNNPNNLYKSAGICTHLCEFCNSNFDSFFELLNHRSNCEFKNSPEKSTLQNIETVEEIKLEKNDNIEKTFCKSDVPIQTENLFVEITMKDNISNPNIIQETDTVVDNVEISVKEIIQLDNVEVTNNKKVGICDTKSCKMCNKHFESKVALNNHKKYLCIYKQKSDGFYCKYCNYNLRKWIECRQHEKKCKLSYRKKKRRTFKFHKSNVVLLNEPPKILENIQMLKPNLNLSIIELENSAPKFTEKILDNYINYENNTLLIESQKDKIELDISENLSISENPPIQSRLETIYDIHFKCLKCSKFFTTQEFLIEHQTGCLKEIIEGTGLIEKIRSKDFKCEKCNKQFKALKNLAQHKVTHSNARNYKCQLCNNKFFKRLNGLNQHVKSVHEGIKPYKCVICNHYYALKSDAARCRHSNLRIEFTKI